MYRVMEPGNIICKDGGRSTQQTSKHAINHEPYSIWNKREIPTSPLRRRWAPCLRVYPRQAYIPARPANLPIYIYCREVHPCFPPSRIFFYDLSRRPVKLKEPGRRERITGGGERERELVWWARKLWASLSLPFQGPRLVAFLLL